jgi:hypothetical protein
VLPKTRVLVGTACPLLLLLLLSAAPQILAGAQADGLVQMACS